MRLHEISAKQGNWLFRWRSYLPLCLIVIFVPGILHFRYLGDNHFYDLMLEVICLSISMSGLFIRYLTVGYVPKGTSGRNTTGQIAESLNTTGAYSILRNPLYLGNYLMMLGVTMMISSNAWWLPLIYTLAFWLYYERIIMAEEAFLSEKFGDEYLEYVTKTPAILPRFRNWRKPDLTFSFRTVLRREHSSLFALISAMFAVEVAGDFVVKEKLYFDPVWLVLFLVTAILYLTLRTLKKITTLLHVDGR